MHSRFTLGEAIRLSGMISLGTKDVAETTMRNKALAALVAQGTKRRSLPDAASIVNTFTPTITSCKIEVLDEEEIATGKRARKLGSDWSVKDFNTCSSVCAYAVL